MPGVCIVARHVQDLDHGTIGIHPHRRPERHERRRSHRAPQDHFCKGGWLAIPPATQQGQQGGKGKQEDARAPGETAQPDGETRDDQIARATGVQVAAKGQHGQQRQAAQEPIEVEQPREGDVKRVKGDEQKTDRSRQRTDLLPRVQKPQRQRDHVGQHHETSTGLEQRERVKAAILQDLLKLHLVDLLTADAVVARDGQKPQRAGPGRGHPRVLSLKGVCPVAVGQGTVKVGGPGEPEMLVRRGKPVERGHARQSGRQHEHGQRDRGVLQGVKHTPRPSMRARARWCHHSASDLECHRHISFSPRHLCRLSGLPFA